MTKTLLGTLALVALSFAACKNAPPEPTPDPTPEVALGATATGRLGATTATPPAPPKPPKKKVTAKPVATVKPSDDDPVKGKWGLDDATKGLPPGKTITATIETDLGDVTCTLFDDKAPITVANFVGLARGVRPWKTPDKKWEKKPGYDGTVFHRIVKGFMIQGGDAYKDGTGEVGYVIPDEVWEDANHDHAGQLCMANRGPNTNSAQFFITDGDASWLDGGYTIFGECGPVETIHKLAGVEMATREKPKQAPAIKKVTITRK